MKTEKQNEKIHENIHENVRRVDVDVTHDATYVDELYDATLRAHELYVSSLIPLEAFLVAFKQFYALAKTSRAERFRDALPDFESFSVRAADLEEDDDAPGVWALYENANDAVARYDRAGEQRQTPPGRSINELLALGVPRAQIAKIYGFYLADGSPDLDAVERRDAWKGSDAQRNVANATNADAGELARLAANALQKINEGGEEVDASTLATLEMLTNGDSDDATEVLESQDARIDREILDGVPLRQIAARYGVSQTTVKARAKALSVAASVAASDVPPRITRQIEQYRDAITEGSMTFQTVAESVSSSERKITAADVERVLTAPPR